MQPAAATAAGRFGSRAQPIVENYGLPRIHTVGEAEPGSAASNLLRPRHPIADPPRYALRVVAANLDFSNGGMRGLFATARRTMITRDAGLAELAASKDGPMAGAG